MIYINDNYKLMRIDTNIDNKERGMVGLKGIPRYGGGDRKAAN
jgi:hypothetical protein